jgi:two-component system sensor histidine kinase ResE
MALFTALVAVPLAVNGIFLSVMGRRSLLHSGAELRGIAEATLRHSHQELIRSATQNAHQSARELIGMNREQLAALGRQQSRLSQNVLRQSNERMIQAGSRALHQAMHRSVQASHDAIDRSNAQMRALHQDALLQVSERMVADARATFQQMGEDLTHVSRKALLQFVAELNQQRARSAAEKASQFLENLTTALNNAIVNLPLSANDPAKVHRALLQMMQQQRLIVYAAVVSMDGRIIARQPQGALPFSVVPAVQKIALTPEAPPPVGRAETEWLLQNPAVSDTMQSGRLNFSPVSLGKGRAPRMTVAVPMFKGSIEMAGVLAVQMSLESLAPVGSHSFCGQDDAPLFIASHEGTLIVPPGERDLPIRRFADALIRSNETGTWIQYEGDAPQTLGAYAKVKGTDWVAVSLVPAKEAMTVAEQIRTALRRAADESSSAMEKKARENADAAVHAATPLHHQVTEDATDRIRQESEAMLREAVKQTRSHQKPVTDAAARRIQSGSQRAAQRAALVMTQHADAAAQESTHKMQEQIEGIAQASLDTMKSASAQSADRSGQQTMIHSASLIAVFLVLALVLAATTAHSIVRPLTQLVAGTEALARGDFRQRVPVQSNDEVGQLAQAFNEMAAALEQSRAELQRNHAMLAQEKSRLHAIVESAPDGLLMLDRSDRVVFLNSTAQRWLGGVENGSAGNPSERFAAVLAVPNRDEPTDVTLNGQGKRVLQIRSVPVTDASGDSYGRLIHLHDVTHEREIDQMKTNFVSLVSHELRTPLTSILAFSAYILTGKWGDLTLRQRTGLESVHRQAKRLHAIISDFLDVSRIESGRVDIQREPVSVAAIAADVIEELRPQAAEKNLSVTLTTETTQPIALADEERIAQVMTNLIGNAIKFTDSGGVSVHIGRDNGAVRVDVNDTGCGIPTDELLKVFDRFYQVERVVTRKTGGTGLGLAIVKNIVEAHGGEVTVISQVGQGTTFSFTLPAVDGTE